ncbi:Structural maintenance of chromosomes protein 5 [Nowakowskiella sp. JEL0078]|nr:Structural maintenance of chromosomes protein 5 [Nowakowskiella sp. JEL0078]
MSLFVGNTLKRVVSDPDDEDLEEEIHNHLNTILPKRKIVHVNEDDENVEIESKALTEETSSQNSKKQRTSTNKGKQVDKNSEVADYCEGAIVRIKLQNFVTYDSLEFFPGPNLNMIIGPNGTGKSTIVCAIALGLGGSPNVSYINILRKKLTFPKLLGRQREIREFVKSGKRDAKIEIELKKNRNNIVITRDFGIGTKNSWKINGEEASQETVKKRVANLDIQVDNLW